jgi:alcohol dehydrogenase class IV
VARPATVTLSQIAASAISAPALPGRPPRQQSPDHGYCCARSLPPIMEYNLPVSSEKYARLAAAFGLGQPGQPAEELAMLAIGFVRQLNDDLSVPPMAELIRAPDLTLLGHKAEQNTSTPSNPRAADAVAFTGMFAREAEF